MGNHTINQNSNEGHLTFEQDLINRYKQRLTMVCKQPNPYDKPLFEYSEIERWIEKLEKLIKKS